MMRDPILEISVKYGMQDQNSHEFSANIQAVINELCRPEVAQRITDQSLLTISDFLDWRTDHLHSDTPPAGSQKMRIGLLVGGKPWVKEVMSIRAIAHVAYHAAKLYGKPQTRARIALALGHFFYRIGMEHAGTAVLNRGVEDAKKSNQSDLLVTCLIEIAHYYNKSNRPGKAWNYITKVLAIGDSLTSKMRIRLWQLAANIMESLHRYEEAAQYHEKVASTPDAGNITVEGYNIFSTNQPQLQSLQEQEKMAAFGARAIGQHALVQVSISNYIALGPSPPPPVVIFTPEGVLHFQMSSYHELFDSMQRLATRVFSIRNSLSWRGSAAAYLRAWAEFIEKLVRIAHKVDLSHRGLQWLEVFKATSLVQRLAISIGPCPSGVDPNDWARLTELIRTYRTMIDKDDSVDNEGTSHIGLTVENLERGIQRLVGELRYQHPNIARTIGAFTPKRELPDSLDFKFLQPDTRIIEFFYDNTGGGCWIINPNTPDRPKWYELSKLRAETVTSLAKEFIKANSAWKASRTRAKHDLGIYEPPLQSPIIDFNNTINKTITYVYESIFKPIKEYLIDENVHYWVLVPHRALHMLPLHAALQKRDYISYSPSLTVLRRLSVPAVTQQNRAFVACDSMTGLPNHPVITTHISLALPAARLEGRYVKRHMSRKGYQVDFLEGTDITVQQVESLITDATLVHMAMHGHFDNNNPTRSGLLFAVDNLHESDLLNMNYKGKFVSSNARDMLLGQLWTLRRIWRRVNLSNCRLAFIAGCETSIVHWDDAMEDFLGLPGGFLQAGAATVIGSLWDVTDLSTLLLTQRFYENFLTKEFLPSKALVEAQWWLRTITSDSLIKEHKNVLMDYYTLLSKILSIKPPSTPEAALDLLLDHSISSNDTPFEAPIYWAPFRCVGLP